VHVISQNTDGGATKAYGGASLATSLLECSQ